MVYLLLLYAIITFCCCWAGTIFYEVIGRFPDLPASYKRPLICYLISGLILLTTIGQWLELFLPLNPLSSIIVISLLAFLSIYRRKKIFNTLKDLLKDVQGQTPLFWVTLAVMLLMILTLNAGPTVMDDTDSYHIQMVKWIQQYGTVPGIANLHLRFGFNSSWFTAIGLLCPRITGAGQYLTLNGLLSCWFCYYLLQKIVASPSREQRTAAALLLTIGLLVWPMLRGNATSANYDFISTCCILTLLSESIDPQRPGLWQEWFLWPSFLFTVRILNAPIMLFSVLAGILYTRQYHRFSWTALSAMALIIIPFITRNILLSGYPLFPLYQFDYFSVDWKADRQELIQITQYIKYFNRSNGNIENVRDIPFPRWLPAWFQQLFIYDRILVGAALLAWSWVGLQWKQAIGLYSPVIKGLVLTLALIIPCWLLAAPDPRFLYGPLLAGPYLFVLHFAKRFYHRMPAWSTRTFLACLTLFIFAYTARKVAVNPDYRNLATPRPLPSPNYKEVWVDGIALRIPDKVLNNWNPRCYDLALPCLYRVNPRLHSRGNNIRQGFRLEGPVGGMNPRLPVGPDNPPQDNGEFKLD